MSTIALLGLLVIVTPLLILSGFAWVVNKVESVWE